MASLLLVFVVIGPFCTAGLPWLPEINSGGIVASGPADLTVGIGRDGYGYLDVDPRREPTLERQIETLLATGRYRRVIIKADRKAAYGALSPIFRAARARGVPVVFISAPLLEVEQMRRERAAAAALR